MNTEQIKASPTISAQEEKLHQIRADQVKRMQESGILQKAQRAYVAEFMNVPSGHDTLELHTSGVSKRMHDELSPEQFGVSMQPHGKSEHVTITSGLFRHIVIGTIKNNENGEKIVEPNSKRGFNVVEVRSVYSMVQELLGLKENGELPDLTDDLQRIEKKEENAVLPKLSDIDQEAASAASGLAKLSTKFAEPKPAEAETPDDKKESEPSEPIDPPLKIAEPVIDSSVKMDLQTAIKMLSYSDVLPEEHKIDAIQAVQKGEESLNYAKELLYLCHCEGQNHVLELARSIVEDCLNILVEKNIPASLYAPSISWALWDIAKQSYLARNPAKSSPEYAENLESPLSLTSKGDRKRGEIRQRHIGWEVMHAWDRGDLKPEDLPKDACKILTTGARTGTGQLRSFELAKLGRIVATS